jgi:hypothetical protein
MADAPETEAVPEPSGDDTPSLAEVNSKVDSIIDTLKRLLPGHGEEPPAAEPEPETPSVAAEVRAELAKLKQAEERKAARENDKSRLDDVEATVKKIAERPPKEYSKITNAVWGRQD